MHVHLCTWMLGCILPSLVVTDDVMIDLTHNVSEKTIYFPMNPPFNFSNAFRLPGVDGYVAEGNFFQTSEHSGTHMDAPRHFCPTGKVVNEIPLYKLTGPGVVLDFKQEAEVDVDFEVTAKHIQDWENIHGQIPDKAVVFFRFGWEKFWPNKALVFNTETFNDTTTYHFPGVSPEAARWLTDNRKLHAIGSDTPSTDYGQTNQYRTHIILLCEHEVIILENVANLISMPPTGTRVYIGGLKLVRGSGTPVRLFAVISGSSSTSSLVLLTIVMLLITVQCTNS